MRRTIGTIVLVALELVRALKLKVIKDSVDDSEENGEVQEEILSESEKLEVRKFMEGRDEYPYPELLDSSSSS